MGQARNPVHPDHVRNHRLLLTRWSRLVLRIPSLELRVFGEAAGYPLVVVESRQRISATPSVYLSAGIHGDEPAGVEGLIQWAGRDLQRLAHWNWQIFPCLNPWGLERNSRLDAEGRDLNRCFSGRRVPQITAQRAVMKGWRHDLSVTLHEDYDARGFYLYEIADARPHWGEGLRDVLSRVMPPESRRTIDGHVARNGVIRRRVFPEMMWGHPEAFCLHFHHAQRTFTLETPSEEALDRRVLLQRRFLEATLKNLKRSWQANAKPVKTRGSDLS